MNRRAGPWISQLYSTGQLSSPPVKLGSGGPGGQRGGARTLGPGLPALWLPALWLPMAAGPFGCLQGSEGPSLRVPSAPTPPVGLESALGAPCLSSLCTGVEGRAGPRPSFRGLEATLLLLNYFFPKSALEEGGQ